MTKAVQHNKAQMGPNTIMEQRMELDDSMLPAAEELAKLKAVKPELVDWVMARAEKEQEARIDFNKKRVKLASRDINGTICVNVMSLVFAFLIIIGGMAATLWTLREGMTVAGTIFAGTTLVGAAALFTRIPKQGKKKE